MQVFPHIQSCKHRKTCKQFAIFFRVCCFVVVFLLNKHRFMFWRSENSPKTFHDSSLIFKQWKLNFGVNIDRTMFTFRLPSIPQDETEISRSRRAFEFSFFPYQRKSCCSAVCGRLVPNDFLPHISLSHPAKFFLANIFRPCFLRLTKFLCCGRIGLSMWWFQLRVFLSFPFGTNTRAPLMSLLISSRTPGWCFPHSC